MDAALALLLLLNAPSIEYMSTAQMAAFSTTTNVTKPTGLELGDVVMAIAGGTVSPTPGWFKTGAGTDYWLQQKVSYTGAADRLAVAYRVIGQDDLDQNWVCDQAPGGLVVVRWRANGANAVSLKTTSTGSFGSTTSAAGYTKSAGHYGSIAVFGERVTTNLDLVPPSDFTDRGRRGEAGYNAMITDNPGSYVDGATVTFSSTHDANGIAMIFEVTGP